MSDEHPAPPAGDLVGITLAVGFIAGLIGVSLWVILPFAGAIIWAAMLVVSTWNGMRWMQARLWNRRWLAVTAITVIMLLALFVPVSLAIVSIVRNADDMVAWVSTLQTFQLPPPPPGWRACRSSASASPSSGCRPPPRASPSWRGSPSPTSTRQ